MKEKYISRVDSYKSSMFGYLVRLYRGKSVLWQEWFPDKKYGGKEKALKAAISQRDKMMKELNYKPGGDKALRKWQPIKKDRKTRSNTGHLGIWESGYTKKRKSGVKKYRYIAVTYVEEKGKNKTQRFYFKDEEGRKAAMKKAIEFRNAKELSARIAAAEYNREVIKRQIEAENKLKMKAAKKNLPIQI
ncbi:MAG TPA: hypothetical protein EYP36_04940 [Calditrichaeota bacterium]|nr:hypothetical protein [Calditrichota bacterium]